VKLHASVPGAANVINAYGEGFVLVNGERHASSLIVLPDRIFPWDVAGFESLQEGHFEIFLGLDIEILLLGTGPKQRFPDPRLTRALMRERVGIEVMDLHAACRTYNFLMDEGRKVAAALLFA
jgi:uncharacterized protein